MPTNETIYELRPIADTSLALTVTGSSKTNGAAAILYAANGYQCQRWKMYVDGITGVFIAQHSSKALYSWNSNPTAGGVVCQGTYQANNTACQWEYTSGANVTINGVSCETVKLKRKGTSLYIDATNPLQGSSADVLLQPTSDEAQTFALYPVFAYWSSSPVPYDCVVSKTASGAGAQNAQDTSSVYVGFKVSKLYDVSMRYRTRTLDLRNQWSAWTAWSAWDAQTLTTANGRYWSEPIATSFALTSAKCMEVNVQLCSQGLYQGTIYYGDASDSTFKVFKAPTVDFTGAVMTPNGLILSYTSDYSPTKVIFTQIGSYEGTYEVEGLGTSGTVTIPLNVCGWYANGATVALKYKVGNDVLTVFDAMQTDSVTVTNEGGSISPTLAIDDYGVLTITGVTGAQGYLICDGEVYEGLSLPIPLNKAFDVWVCKDGDNWGVKKTSFAAQTVSKACHIIAGEKTLYIRYNAGAGLSESITVSAESTSTALDGAKWMHVAMSGTRDGSIPVEGVLVNSDTTSDADIRDMVGTHGLWRGPYGTLMRVAIVSANTKREKKLTSVSIDLEVET